MELPIHFFERMKTGSDIAIIGGCYLWTENNEDFKAGWERAMTAYITPPVLLVSDDYRYVAPVEPYESMQDGVRLWRLDCIFRNPMVLLEQIQNFEEIYGSGTIESDELLRNAMNEYFGVDDYAAGDWRHNRFNRDSVIYTAHPQFEYQRLAVLLEPRNQILGIKEVPVDDEFVHSVENFFHKLMGDAARTHLARSHVSKTKWKDYKPQWQNNSAPKSTASEPKTASVTHLRTVTSSPASPKSSSPNTESSAPDSPETDGAPPSSPSGDAPTE